MPLDLAYIGRTYPVTAPYLVGRPKIREFADAIGATDAVYRDPEAARALGYPDVIAPPTFAIVLTAETLQMVIDDEGLGLDFTRVVHGDQRYAYRRPIHAGDELTCLCTIAEIMERAGNGFLTTRTEIGDRRGRAGGDRLVQDRGRAPRPRTKADPMPLTPLTFPITRTDLVRYAGASGDFNPIHWSDRVATGVGLPGVIAHGMLTMALASRAVTVWVGGDPGAILEYQVRFTRPILVPDDDTRHRADRERHGAAASRIRRWRNSI